MVKFENRVVFNKVCRFTETIPVLIFFHCTDPSSIRKNNNKDLPGSFDFLQTTSAENLIDKTFLKKSVAEQSFLQILSKDLQVAQPQFEPLLGNGKILLIKNKYLEKALNGTGFRNKNHTFSKKVSFSDKEKTKSLFSTETTLLNRRGGDQRELTVFTENSNCTKQKKDLLSSSCKAKLCNTERLSSKLNKNLWKQESRGKETIERSESGFVSDNMVDIQKSEQVLENKLLLKSSLLKGNRFAFFYKNLEKSSTCQDNFFPKKFENAFFGSGEHQNKNIIVLGGIYKNKIIDHNQIQRLFRNNNEKLVYLRLNNILKGSLNRLLSKSYYHCKIINLLKLKSQT